MSFDVLQLVVLLGIPSACTGFCVWRLRKHLDRKDAARDEKDKERREFDFTVLRGVSASLTLGEATARAVQKIPDAHCNGDMRSALDYATRVKHEQKDFLTRQGIANLHNN